MSVLVLTGLFGTPCTMEKVSLLSSTHAEPSDAEVGFQAMTGCLLLVNFICDIKARRMPKA